MAQDQHLALVRRQHPQSLAEVVDPLVGGRADPARGRGVLRGADLFHRDRALAPQVVDGDVA